MIRRWAVPPGALLVAVCWYGSCAAAEPVARSLRATIGWDYTTGDYGTSSATDILYVPFTARGEIGRWSVRCTIPYIYIRSGGGVVQGPDGPIATTSGVEDGLGDVLARGSYTLPSELWWIPWIEFGGLVKFPTASRRRGLGTGEFDFGIETELTWAGRRFTPFATLGYRFLGSAPDLPLRNVFGATVGAQYRVLTPLDLGLLLDYRQAASATSGQRLELVPFASVRLKPHWTFGLYVIAGLADGSPDAGVGMQVGYAL